MRSSIGKNLPNLRRVAWPIVVLALMLGAAFPASAQDDATPSVAEEGGPVGSNVGTEIGLEYQGPPPSVRKIPQPTNDREVVAPSATSASGQPARSRPTVKPRR